MKIWRGIDDREKQKGNNLERSRLASGAVNPEWGRFWGDLSSGFTMIGEAGPEHGILLVSSPGIITHISPLHTRHSRQSSKDACAEMTMRSLSPRGS